MSIAEKIQLILLPPQEASARLVGTTNEQMRNTTSNIARFFPRFFGGPGDEAHFVKFFPGFSGPGDGSLLVRFFFPEIVLYATIF